MIESVSAAGRRNLQPARPWVRSMMFVPGNRADLMVKASTSGADAVVLDLEDATPAAEKASAREQVREFVAASSPTGPAIFVRINGLDDRLCAEDLDAVVSTRVAGVMVPKVEAPADIQFVGRHLDWIEDELGVERGRTSIVPVFETARGIRSAFEIASASERVAYAGGLSVRGGDIERAVGFRWTPTGEETLVLRSGVLLDMRAAGVPNPLTGMWSNVKDLEGLRGFATASRDLGYEGMLCIHPSHVAVINECFTPSDAELDRDQRLVSAMAAGQTAGRGAVSFDGEMVDGAMAATARQRLERFRPPPV